MMENGVVYCPLFSRRKRQRSEELQGCGLAIMICWLFVVMILTSGASSPLLSSSLFPLQVHGFSYAFSPTNSKYSRRTRPRPDLYHTVHSHGKTTNKKQGCRAVTPTLLVIAASATTKPMYPTNEEEEWAEHDITDPMDYSKIRSNPSSLSLLTGTFGPRALDGLSQMHQALFSRLDRQRFVTGRFPLTVTVRENPTRHWLGLGRRTTDSTSPSSSSLAGTEVLINGTTPSRSLASLDCFHWLDDDERDLLRNKYSMVSLELLAEIQTERPGYVHIMSQNGAGGSAIGSKYEPSSLSSSRSSIIDVTSPAATDVSEQDQDRLWVSGFSLAGRRGLIKSIDADTATFSSIGDYSASCVKWPNEVQVVPQTLQQSWYQGDDDRKYRDALLICDGFLVPGKDRGGVYVVLNPGSKIESIRCLTEGGGVPTRGSTTASLHNAESTITSNNSGQDRWFYHRAIWVDLTGDNRLSILTARCQVSLVGNSPSNADTSTLFTATGITKVGQLVWIECPNQTEASLDGNSHQTSHEKETLDPFDQSWKTHILARGPDVMHCLADMDPSDETIEVISSEFFNRRLTLYSIKRGPKPRIVFSRIIDENCGSAFGCILTDLDRPSPYFEDISRPKVVDQGTTVVTLNAGEPFSHVLVTSHECTYTEAEQGREVHRTSLNGGVSSVFSADEVNAAGGSLFAYRVPRGKNAWKTEPWERTTIATGFKVRGRLGNMINPGAPGFVYAFYAQKTNQITEQRPMIAVAGDCAESVYIYRPANADECSNPSNSQEDPSTRYKLMAEIECGATVGSIGIGYNDFREAQSDPKSNYARLYIPCFEKDKVLVFGMGNGDEDYLTDT